MYEIGKTIPEYDLILRPTSDEGRKLVGHAHAPREVGNRNKLGGEPDWIQYEEWPDCCDKKMTFYAQLDSIGDDIHLGDCGLLYVFVCFDCFSSKSVLQFA